MAPDNFTETSSESWLSRITSSIKGIFFGFILIIGAFYLLFWNEGRAVKTATSLDEGKKAVVHVASDKVDPANEGKLVHLSGSVTTDDVLTDPEFKVSINAIKLNRQVLMYQWKESSQNSTTNNIGGGTTTTKTYSYSQTWSERLIDSSSFKHPQDHQNPHSMPYQSRNFAAKNVKMNAFTLSGSLIDKMSKYETYDVSIENLNQLGINNIQGYDGGYYIGSSLSNPQIGDIKVLFKVIKPFASISLIAKQIDSTFEPYYTANGRQIELLTNDYVDADSMFENAKTQNSILTWVLRAVGWLLMFFGFSALFAPLTVLADFIPFLGTLVGLGTGTVAFLLTMVCSFCTIAIAWLVYRPLLSLILIVAVAAIVVIIMLIKQPHNKVPVQ